MSELRRVDFAPAWILHRYPYRETSLILEVLSRDHGRLGLVGRGARRGSRSGALIAPFAPVAVSFRRRGDLGNLAGIESAGPPYAFSGAAFFAACYLNELVLRLLPRDDPAPEVFALYSDALAGLAAETSPAQPVRRFEGRLVRALGFASPLDRDRGGKVLDGRARYRYDPRHGVVAASPGEGFTGLLLRAIAAERFDEPGVLDAAAEIFRSIIMFHLGGRPLKTLEVARAAARQSGRGGRAA